MEAIPEATRSLVETWGGGYRLAIAVPPLPEGDLLARGRLGWRAHLVAGVAATDDERNREWAVTQAGMSRDDAQLVGAPALRSKPGTPLPNGPFPRLGTASIDEARAQLESNLGV